MPDILPLKIVGHREQFADGDTIGIEHGGTSSTTAIGARVSLGFTVPVMLYDESIVQIETIPGYIPVLRYDGLTLDLATFY